jgi:hypothetical protein
MMDEEQRTPLVRYAIAYVAWLVLCAAAGFALFQVSGALLELSLAMRANQWVARAWRQLSLPVIGILWIVYVFWAEHALRTAAQRGRLRQRALQFGAAVVVLLVLLAALRALL